MASKQELAREIIAGLTASGMYGPGLDQDRLLREWMREPKCVLEQICEQRRATHVAPVST